MTLTLEPHDYEEIFYSLVPAYGDGDPLPILAPTRRFLRAGTYTVQAEYNSGTDSISVLSNIVTFLVAEPEGDELKAYELLKKADSLGSSHQSINVLELLRRTYPKSVYCPEAFDLQTHHLIYENRPKALELAKTWLDTFPDHESVISAMMYLLVYVPDEAKREQTRHEVLNRVIKKYAGTLAADYSKRILEKEKRKK
jgi:hypothetical protein